MADTRVCSFCKRTLPIDEFLKTGIGPTGKVWRLRKCKQCHYAIHYTSRKESKRRWVEKNRDKQRGYIKAYHKRNRARLNMLAKKRKLERALAALGVKRGA